MMSKDNGHDSLLAIAVRLKGGRRKVVASLLLQLLRRPWLLFTPRLLLKSVIRTAFDGGDYRRTGINLIGHVYAVLGRAEDIRTAARACNAAKIPMLLMNRNGDYDSQLQSLHPGFPFFGRVRKEPEYSTNLFFLNADEMPMAYEHYGPALFRGRYNIGCFAWELSIFPKPWHNSFEGLDELWAPTQFIKLALQDATDKPVIHMPFVVEPGPVGGHTRADLGLPGDKFIFLFFFDFRSYVSRKNPFAVLDAFFRAFPEQDQDKVHLVIKVNGIESKQLEFDEFLRDDRVSDRRVQIITRAMDDAGINSLVSLSDCFVSLHRSEGFGRGLAEAMYYRKPVIATAYSGNLDFMNESNSCLVDYKLIPLQDGDYPYWQGQCWADADVEQAAWYMRKLIEDTPYMLNLAEQAHNTITTHHSSAAVGLLMRNRLEKIGLIQPHR